MLKCGVELQLGRLVGRADPGEITANQIVPPREENPIRPSPIRVRMVSRSLFLRHSEITHVMCSGVWSLLFAGAGVGRVAGSPDRRRPDLIAPTMRGCPTT